MNPKMYQYDTLDQFGADSDLIKQIVFWPDVTDPNQSHHKGNSDVILLTHYSNTIFKSAQT